ncbi:MAG: hypothetical protein SFW67_17765 [Myxococcaceae bacterium]|nr:hypothetical protein [Myxococcaceae bacterium]
MSRKKELTTLDHDLGPGVSYATEQWVSRAYAQAAFTEAARGQANPAQVPDAVVYEYDFKAPKDVFDFSSGALLQEFERSTCALLTAEVAERMYNGEVNPVLYNKAVRAFVESRKLKLADLKVVVGPDYRHSIAGNGQLDDPTDCAALTATAGKKGAAAPTSPTRRQPQVRINDKKLVDSLDQKAMRSLEVRFPSAADVAAAMVGHRTHTLFGKCTPTAKSGSCKAWSYPAGQLLFMRRKWQSAVFHKPGNQETKVNHYHLRVGDVIVDGTFMQFDGDAADDEAKAELFVGTAGELIARLNGFGKPEIPNADGKRMFDAFWNAPPAVPMAEHLEFKTSGEVEWFPN